MANARQFLAARTAAWAKSGGGSPTARDYVQDGLIAMWDGIENAGWGVHDANATAWSNLSGIGDATLTGAGNYLKWENNRLKVFTFSSNGSSYVTFPSGSIPSSARTIEMVFFYVNGGRYSRIIQSNRDSDGPEDNIMLNYNGVESSSSAVLAARLGQGQINSNLTISKYVINSVGFAVSSANDFKFWVNSNGSAISVYNNFIRVLSSSLRCGISKDRASSANKSDLYVYNLRFYDHKITDAERAANYAVDKARFGLT